MSCKNIIKPNELKEKLYLTNDLIDNISNWRKEVNNIIMKKSKKFLVIVGPCSIHDKDQALEYAKKLKELSSRYENIFVIMRVYFEKPRTTVGWKGLIQDPDLDCSNDLEKGLYLAREILLEISKLGLPSASEFLEPLQVIYYDDLVSYIAIGARTTESQVHREMASGYNFALGFKNSTDGSVENAINSILASSLSHTFLSVNDFGELCIKKTNGNRFGHVILRGGKKGSNYDEKSIEKALQDIKKQGISSGIIVDASHANSGKIAKNQIKVVEEVVKQRKNGNNEIVGIMVESNIFHGSQSFNPCKDDKNKLKLGISITDECLGLDDTEILLDYISKNL